MRFIVAGAALALVLASLAPGRAVGAGTFGYTSVGASVSNLDVYGYGTRFTAPESLSVTSVTVYVVTTDSSSSVKVAVFNDSTGVLLATGAASVAQTTGAWITVPLDTPTGTVPSGAVVMLAARGDAGTGSLKGRYDTGAVDQAAYATVTYAAFPADPWVTAGNQARQHSIYATYDTVVAATDTPVATATDTPVPATNTVVPTETSTPTATETATPVATTPATSTAIATSTATSTRTPAAGTPDAPNTRDAADGPSTSTVVPAEPSLDGLPPASGIDPSNGGDGAPGNAAAGVQGLPDVGRGVAAQGSTRSIALLIAVAAAAAGVSLVGMATRRR